MEERRHIAGVRLYLPLLLAALLGCSSSPLVLPKRPALPVRGALPRDARPPGLLYRDEVERAISAGLGYFLQRVDLRAVTQADDSGRPTFVGFEILALRPAQDWLKFDFTPGDVVTKIDGISVEHYDSVIPMFEGLRAKDRFEVQLVRSGAPKTVVIRIADRAGGKSKPLH